MKNGQVPPTLKWFDSYSTPQAAEEFVAGAIEETFAKTFYDKYCIDMWTNYTSSSYGIMEIDFGDYGVILYQPSRLKKLQKFSTTARRKKRPLHTCHLFSK